MGRRYDCEREEHRRPDLPRPRRRTQGELVVLPTDTVYGIGADAFTPSGRVALLEAKGRGRDMPAAVLVGSAEHDRRPGGGPRPGRVGPHRRVLAGRADAGVPSTRSLQWDLGDTKGTVAVRMPLHPVALELLKERRPDGRLQREPYRPHPRQDGGDAEEKLGDSVAVYLDGGPCPAADPSTILDLTGPDPAPSASEPSPRTRSAPWWASC